jgi:DNA adenine methylase
MNPILQTQKKQNNMESQLRLFHFEPTGKHSKDKVVNVASVPQRSPFRYPGGKTWAIPVVRKWLSQGPVKLLVEPFVGGGIVSLTAAAEGLAERVVMVEMDSEVAAVWKTITSNESEWLVERILNFDLTIENIQAEINKEPKGLKEVALCTILKNRTYHGGILAKGSGLLKFGENGKGIKSRWYPETLAKRIRETYSYREKLTPVEGDAFDYLKKYKVNPECYFFIDPPYFVAGRRLYTHFDIDHERLFKHVSEIQGKFLLTYDDAQEIRDLATRFNLAHTTIPMKTTHHLEKRELLISDNFDWLLS